MFSKISGVELIKRVRMSNGGDSYVIPFATSRPFNLVVHGENHFEYGHYGIHLGQMDRLTFFSHDHKIITLKLVDFREESESYGLEETKTVIADGKHELVIPPGVAHTFSDLAGIATINNYEIFLPDAEAWINGETDWDLGNDIVNVPLKYSNSPKPRFKSNQKRASNQLYDLIAMRQSSDDSKTEQFGHALTEDVNLNGETFRLKIREPKQQQTPDFPFISGIRGVEWRKNKLVETGPESGIIPFPKQRPFYVVDHGRSIYEHDAFGVHLGQEDNLTFFGPKNSKVKITLKDCRESSVSSQTEETFQFKPEPGMTLTIPQGVAHAFVFEVGIFTINQPKVFLREDGKDYDMSTDVIDIPIDAKEFPKIRPYSKTTSKKFYEQFAKKQYDFLHSNEKISTPVVLLAKDDDGNDVRVAFREKVEA